MYPQNPELQKKKQVISDTKRLREIFFICDSFIRVDISTTEETIEFVVKVFSFLTICDTL